LLVDALGSAASERLMMGPQELVDVVAYLGTLKKK
jgi:hypothetical protein